MLEVIWHGRGGQGAFTAARLLGAAASLVDGLHSLAFPSFGPERRGAPIRAFTKISTSQIGNRSEIEQADYVVYLDDTLFVDTWEKELKPNGKVLLNSKKNLDDERIVCIDASGIANEILGRDIPNTVFVAQICKLSDNLSLNCAKEAVQEYMPDRLVAKNLHIIEYIASCSTFENVSGNEREKSEKPRIAHAIPVRAARRNNNVKIPTLRTNIPTPYEFSHNTCWEAGFLTTSNSGWRTIRPEVDIEKCAGCLKCYMDCPDGCIFKTEHKKVAVDYDFCKGCGICATSCKFDAIKMTPDGSE